MSWTTIEARKPGTCHLCGEAVEVGETVRYSPRYGLEHPGGNRNGQCGRMVGDRTIGEAAGAEAPQADGPRCIWKKVAGDWAVLVQAGAGAPGDTVTVTAKSGRTKTVTLGEQVGPNTYAVLGTKKAAGGRSTPGAPRLMQARRSGKCAACGGAINVGDEILWSKAEGAVHADSEVCASYSEQAAEMAMEQAAEARMYGEVA